jgi:polyisoprenoid-binding protein YceI
MIRKIARILLLTVLTSGSALAAEIRVRIPPESADITFELKATMHTVHGTAALERAEFVIDTSTGSVSGEAVVSAASADTGNKKRDKKMHSTVLHSDSHPKIAFRAHRFEGTIDAAGTSEISLVGVMEILGVEHPLTVPVEVNTTEGTARASFTVPYVDWGLDDPSTFVLRVGKVVPVTIAAPITVVSDAASP